MPIPLHELPETWSLAISTDAFNSTCEALIAHMSENPPICLDTMESTHAYPAYLEKINNQSYQPERMRTLKAIMDIVFKNDKSFIPLALQNIIDCSGIENINKMATAQQDLFLMQHSILFSVTKIGNCADRAAYAALVLFKALEDTTIKIALQSLKTKDHFYVCLGNAEKGWKIYDPLTNPTLLFDIEEYQKDVLIYIPQYLHPKKDFKRVINSHVYNQYIEQRDQAPALIQNALLSSPANKLWKNREFHSFLVSRGIEKNVLSDAHQYLCSCCEQDHKVSCHQNMA
jgi:hypothetical protein